MENFSLEDWNTLISNLQVSDADNDVVRMQVLQSPRVDFYQFMILSKIMETL